jgi:hypothetical protein
LAGDGLDALLLVEGVPELRDDNEIFTLYDTFIDSPLDPNARLLLIAVICARSRTMSGDWVKISSVRTKGTIEQPVSGLDRVVDDTCSVIGDFPQTKPTRTLSDQHLIYPDPESDM